MDPLSQIPVALRESIESNSERLLIGWFLNWMFYGILTVQVALYLTAFATKDTFFVKTIVCGLYLLETVQTGLITANAFKTAAIGFGNLDIVNQVWIAWLAVPVMSGIIACIVQGVYVYRIYVLSKSRILCSVITLLSTTQLIGALILGWQAKEAVYLTAILSTKSTLVTAGIWEGSCAACDIIIAACMTYYLRSQRDSQFRDTHAIITRIIRLCIGTGAVTAALALITLILAYLHGNQLYWIPIVTVLGKAYTNSIMVVFNSRIKVVSNSGLTPVWNEDKIPMERPHGTTTSLHFRTPHPQHTGFTAQPSQVESGVMSGSMF